MLPFEAGPQGGYGQGGYGQGGYGQGGYTPQSADQQVVVPMGFIANLLSGAASTFGGRWGQAASPFIRMLPI
jgi:hypothetical protein